MDNGLPLASISAGVSVLLFPAFGFGSGFGAGGPHFCLGANLARREVSVMFQEIARRMPTLRTEGEPAYLQSSFINGVKRLQCSW